MISNLSYVFGKQEELQSHVKGLLPKKVTASDANVGLRYLGELCSYTFLFREPEFDPVPELMISRQKIGLLVIVSRYGNTSTG